MAKVWPLLFCASMLAACSTMSPEDIRRSTSEQLCINYESTKNPAVRAELERRKEIPQADWKALDDGSIAVGMSRLGLICGLSHPSMTMYGAINTTVTPAGKVEQFVYRKSSGKAYYIYLRNGRVTSWQY